MAAFGLPLLFVQAFGTGTTPTEDLVWQAEMALTEAQIFAPAIPALAVMMGIIVALAIWSWDHRGDHVYALSLPLPRWEYALIKMAGGWCYVAAVSLVFFAGCVLAASAISLPESLRAYPGLLAFRFLLASSIAFSISFSLAAGTMRTTLGVISVIVGLVVLDGIFVGFFRDMFPAIGPFSLVGWFSEAAIHWPGPFEVFLGNWMLVDV